MRSLLLTALLAVAPSLQADTAEDLQARGRAEFEAGRYRAAVRYFERSVDLCADESYAQVVALSNAGQAYLELGERTRAEALFRRALEIQPQVPGLWHRLGQCELQNKRYGDAEQALLKAVQLWQARSEPDIAMALNDLAIVYQNQHKPALARDAWERAAATAPPGQVRARILSNLGGFCWKTGEKQLGITKMVSALVEMEKTVGPNHPDVARILDDYAVMLARTGHRASQEAGKTGERYPDVFFGQRRYIKEYRRLA